MITLSRAEKAGQDLDLNASFEHGGELPTGQLAQLQEIVASGVHAIYGVMLVLTVIGIGVSFLLIKHREQTIEKT